MMQILDLLVMYFDAAVVFDTNSLLLFRLAMAILCCVYHMMLSQLFHNCAQHGFTNSRKKNWRNSSNYIVNSSKDLICSCFSKASSWKYFNHGTNTRYITKNFWRSIVHISLMFCEKKSKQKKMMLKLFQIESSCWK